MDHPPPNPAAHRRRPRRSSRHTACLGTVLANKTAPRDRAADRRKCERRHGAPGHGTGLRATRPAGRRRKSPRRRQYDRNGRGRESGPGRLHHSGQFFDPHGDTGYSLQSGLRDERPRPHRPTRKHAGRHGVQPVKGLQAIERFRRRGQSQARFGQLCVRGRRQFIPSQRRAVSAGSWNRGGSSAFQRRARSDDRSDRRPRRLLFSLRW